MSSRVAIYEPSPVLLSSFTSVRREPICPVETREPDFHEKFDDDTLFFDAFWSGAKDEIMLIGPSLFNLAEAIQNLQITAHPEGTSCSFRLRNLDRQTRVRVNAPRGTTHLSCKSELGEFEVVVRPNQSHQFAGLRVCLTLSKNNDLTWVRDWFEFNRDVHGADAILFYDNNSDLYAAEEVQELLNEIPGMSAARVVRWPFKYGPQGTFDKRTWASFFCQTAVLEHARWQHLSLASSVLNSDIDELIVSNSGLGVFEAVEKSQFGVLSIPGRWMMAISGVSPEENALVRHQDYQHVLNREERKRFGVLKTDANGCAPKWIVVPGKCPNYAQWNTHAIQKWPVSRFPSTEFSFRHFREITTNWKYKRDERETYDPERHLRDELLLNAFRKAGWITD